jgi:hypothetical protein
MNIIFSLIELISFSLSKNTQNTIQIACLKQTVIFTRLIVDLWNETFSFKQEEICIKLAV